MSRREAVDTFRNGFVTVGVTQTLIVSGKGLPDGPYKGILIKAPGSTDDVSNTVGVYLGPSGVTANYNAVTGGFPLAPGESITLPLEQVDSLYAIATMSSQTLAWIMI